MPVVAALVYAVLAPQPGQAIPAFARKFGVKCYACHPIPPALNKTGYMFKRLGYRMPPDEMDGTKPAPKIAELDKDIKFSITNSLAVIAQGSFTVDKTKGDGISPTSSSSFNLDEAALFVAGAVPDSGFSYFTHFELYQGGSTNLEQAVMGYTAGRANSSFFVKAGEMHMQEGEGTRAAMFYNLFPDPAPILENTSPVNFSPRPASRGGQRGIHLGFELLQAGIRGLGQSHQRSERRRQRDSVQLHQELQGLLVRRRLLVRSRWRHYLHDVSRHKGPDAEPGRRRPVHLPPQHPPLWSLWQLPVLRQIGHSRRISARRRRLAGGAWHTDHPLHLEWVSCARWITTSSAASQ